MVLKSFVVSAKLLNRSVQLTIADFGIILVALQSALYASYSSNVIVFYVMRTF